MENGSLEKTLKSLRSLNPTLNKTSDEANKVITLIEQFLQAIGISFEVEELTPDDVFAAHTILSFARFNGDYRFAVKYSGEIDPPTAIDDYSELAQKQDAQAIATREWEEFAWSSCPREIRLEAFALLPQLLEGILEKARNLAKSADKAIETVAKFAVLAETVLGSRQSNRQGVGQCLRLREAKAEYEATDKFEQGVRAGCRWAKEKAEAHELKRLDAFYAKTDDLDLFFGYEPDGSLRLGWEDSLFFVIAPKSRGDSAASKRFWEAVGQPQGNYESVDSEWGRGFLTGAAERPKL